MTRETRNGPVGRVVCRVKERFFENEEAVAHGDDENVQQRGKISCKRKRGKLRMRGGRMLRPRVRLAVHSWKQKEGREQTGMEMGRSDVLVGEGANEIHVWLFLLSQWIILSGQKLRGAVADIASLRKEEEWNNFGNLTQTYQPSDCWVVLSVHLFISLERLLIHFYPIFGADGFLRSRVIFTYCLFPKTILLPMWWSSKEYYKEEEQDRDLASQTQKKEAAKAKGSTGFPQANCSPRARATEEHLVRVTQLAQCCQCPSKTPTANAQMTFQKQNILEYLFSFKQCIK